MISDPGRLERGWSQCRQQLQELRTGLSAYLLSLMLLAACGHEVVARAGMPSASRQPHGYTVATGTDTGNRLAARFEGVLHGRVNADNTACFWIEIPPKAGTSFAPVAVMWPWGSRALPGPLRVVLPDGAVIAKVGEYTVLTGGAIASEAIPITGCPDFTNAFGG